MNGIAVLTRDSFPPALLEIPEPPEKLYCRGKLPSPKDYIYLTVIGSRKYTSYGQNACQALIEGLRGYNITIVSGLALGIDSIAHRAALDAGLPTVAIPGSGIDEDVLYPRTHIHLAREIVSKGGAVISEFEPNFKATSWSFPKRNRLMAGISKAVLVIEAEERSGTSITARLALDYNRDVFSVPGSIFSSNSVGTNRLIKEGATPVTKSADILSALGFSIQTVAPVSPNELSENESVIWELIEEPKTRDELIEISSLEPQAVNTALTILELKGLIRESGGFIRRFG